MPRTHKNPRNSFESTQRYEFITQQVKHALTVLSAWARVLLVVQQFITTCLSEKLLSYALKHLMKANLFLQSSRVVFYLAAKLPIIPRWAKFIKPGRRVDTGVHIYIHCFLHFLIFAHFFALILTISHQREICEDVFQRFKRPTR